MSVNRSQLVLAFTRSDHINMPPFPPINILDTKQILWCIPAIFKFKINVLFIITLIQQPTGQIHFYDYYLGNGKGTPKTSSFDACKQWTPSSKPSAHTFLWHLKFLQIVSFRFKNYAFFPSSEITFIGFKYKLEWKMLRNISKGAIIVLHLRSI